MSQLKDKIGIQQTKQCIEITLLINVYFYFNTKRWLIHPGEGYVWLEYLKNRLLYLKKVCVCKYIYRPPFGSTVTILTLLVRQITIVRRPLFVLDYSQHCCTLGISTTCENLS